jgi:hypothetical protein
MILLPDALSLNPNEYGGGGADVRVVGVAVEYSKSRSSSSSLLSSLLSSLFTSL